MRRVHLVVILAGFLACLAGASTGAEAQESPAMAEKDAAGHLWTWGLGFVLLERPPTVTSSSPVGHWG